MSDTEKKVESVEEQKNPANRDAAPAEAPTLKNDAEDLGAPVVKPTDSNPDATKKIKKVSDQVNKDANDGSLPNDQKPSSVKKEEVFPIFSCITLDKDLLFFPIFTIGNEANG